MKLAKKIWLKIQRNSMFTYVFYLCTFTNTSPFPILLVFLCGDLQSWVLQDSFDP